MTIKLPVKVVPGSSRECLAGWLGETLKVRVTAPPELGKANQALERLLADALGLSRQSVRVVTGKTSTQKVVEIMGLSEADVALRLSEQIHK